MHLSSFQHQFTKSVTTHLNHAALSRPPIESMIAMKESIDAVQTLGAAIDQLWVPQLFKLYPELARFFHAQESEVALTQNVSHALSLVAYGYPFQKGQNIVVFEHEYASNYLPWFEIAKEKSLELRIIPATKPGVYDFKEFEEKIDKNTAIVAVSWVQFLSGQVVDLDQLADLAHSKGASLIADGIQALGAIPFDFSKSKIDFMAGASHKWMHGGIGIGFFLAKEEFLSRLKRTSTGAASYNLVGSHYIPGTKLDSTSKRFQTGALPFIELIGFLKSVELRNQIDSVVVHQEIIRLNQKFRFALMNSTLPIHWITPLDCLSGITSVQLKDPILQKKVFETAKQQHLNISERGPYLRFSIHGMNTDHDIERALGIFS